MRTIEWTKQFKKDYKREASGRHAKDLDENLRKIINLLAADSFFPERYMDHALKGEWQDFRDCHIKLDLVLIYRKPDKNTLQLVRLGSHSELGF